MYLPQIMYYLYILEFKSEVIVGMHIYMFIVIEKNQGFFFPSQKSLI